MTKPTKAQLGDLAWLKKHGGDGGFDKKGRLLAAGELRELTYTQDEYMSVMSQPNPDFAAEMVTWLALEAAGLVQFYGGNSGRGRVRIIK